MVVVVVKETYEANPSTATNVALAFKDAFIDAGYMTDWHDSFSDGSRQHRILKIIYDAAKACGTTYYWFVFNDANIYVNISKGWDVTNHVPTGTQYLDYVSTATNTTANHMLFKAFSSSINVLVTRWTSGVNSNFSWFLVQNSATTFNFGISKVAPSFIDLDKQLYHGLMWFQPTVAGKAASGRFRLFPLTLRGHHLGSAALRGITDGAGGVGWYGAGTGGEPWGGATSAIENMLATHSYHLGGNVSVEGQNFSFTGQGVLLPGGFANTNTRYSTDETPISTGLLLNLYSSATLPSDFGIAPNYSDNTMALNDNFIVKDGGGNIVSEWDIVALANAASGQAGAAPSIMFLARYA